MTTDKKATKIEFAPGCFDHFEGTQEELEKLQADIIAMFESGEMEAEATEVDLDELMAEDPEYAAMLIESLMRDEDTPRNLH